MISENDVRILAIAIALAGLKEYKADWLKNANTVVRDASGRFASKASDVKQAIAQKGEEAKEIAELVGEGGKIAAKTINSLRQDKEFRQRAGLVAGRAGAELMKNLVEKVKSDSDYAQKLETKIQEIEASIVKTYGDDKSPFAQAMRKSDLSPPESGSFADKMEYRIAQYKAYEEALEKPEEYSKPKEMLAKAAKAAIPVATIAALTLGPDLVIGLLLKESLGSILASSATGFATSLAVNKALDTTDIENPWIRLGIDMAANFAVGGMVLKASKAIGGMKREAKTAGKVMEEVKKATIDEHAIDNAAVHISTRQWTRKVDYRDMKILKDGSTEDLPGLSERSSVEKLAAHASSLGDTDFSVVIARKGEQLLLEISNLRTSREDVNKRPIRNYITWIWDDSDESEKVARSLAVKALRGDLDMEIDLAVKEGEMGIRIDREKFSEIASPDKSLGSASPNEKPKFQKRSQESINELAEELLTSKLPKGEGVIVALVSSAKRETLEKAGVTWRGISDLVKE